MKRLGQVVFVLLGIAALIYGTGWMLPVAHTASRSATFAATPQEVYDVIADVEAYPQWWTDIERVEILPSPDGRVRFRQHSNGEPIAMEVVDAAPPGRFVTRIADPDQPFGGTWTFEITPENTATRLTITERGEVYDPLFRFMSRFVFGHTGTIDRFLSSMREVFQARVDKGRK
jgi:uncharacterized protein YndB with AHSA1/START domain